jgi:hypothetical protein
VVDAMLLASLPLIQAQSMLPRPSQIARRPQAPAGKMDVWLPSSPPLRRRPQGRLLLPVFTQTASGWSTTHPPMPLPLVLVVAQPHNRSQEALRALLCNLVPLALAPLPPLLLPLGLLELALVESVVVVINVSPASTTCFNSPAVLTALQTPHLFADEVPIASRPQWKHHRFSLRTVHPWVLQDLKRTNLAADPTVVELLI